MIWERHVTEYQRKVMELVTRKKGLPEILVKAVMSLYKRAETKVRVGSGLLEEFFVKVGVQFPQKELRPGSFSRTFIAIECENHSHHHKRELFHLIIVQL